MRIRSWEELPEWMKISEVEEYYRIIRKKRISFAVKRIFDVFLSALLLVILSPVFIAISFMILLDSRGGIFFRQARVTTYGKIFRIHKFRTMKKGAESAGSILARDEDERITRVGRVLRKYRLDELPQLIDVLKGDMSFVGPRPQSVCFVKHFSREARAVFLVPAGITSETTLKYMDEGSMLKETSDIDEAYIRDILPDKMKLQLEEIKSFGLIHDIRTMLHTVRL